jgi:hypothetical protein
VKVVRREVRDGRDGRGERGRRLECGRIGWLGRERGLEKRGKGLGGDRIWQILAILGILGHLELLLEELLDAGELLLEGRVDGGLALDEVSYVGRLVGVVWLLAVVGIRWLLVAGR